MLRFKDLARGDCFEFDHSGLPLAHGLQRGPWVKVSTRLYTPRDEDHRLKGHRIEVGTVNVKVVSAPLPSMMTGAD